MNGVKDISSKHVDALIERATRRESRIAELEASLRPFAERHDRQKDFALELASCDEDEIAKLIADCDRARTIIDRKL